MIKSYYINTKLYKRMEQYAQDHDVTVNKVVTLALIKFLKGKYNEK